MKPPPNLFSDIPTDYLKLPFAWVPAQRSAHGQTSEYRLVLPDGSTAVLRLVPDKGWEMSLVDVQQHQTARGLFATPHDALMVLVAEYAA